MAKAEYNKIPSDIGVGKALPMQCRLTKGRRPVSGYYVVERKSLTLCSSSSGPAFARASERLSDFSRVSDSSKPGYPTFLSHCPTFKTRITDFPNT